MVQRFIRLFVKVGFALAFLCSMSAFGAPKKVIPITFTGDAGEEGFVNFPLLVKLSESAVSGFSYGDLNGDGSDLSFEYEDGTPLSYEIDLWNPEGESLVWVRVPLLNEGTTIYCKYNDSAVTAPQASGAATWGGDYLGVWHLNEAEDCEDATGHGFTATRVGNAAYLGAVADAPTGAGKQIGAGSSSKDYLSISSYDSYGVGGNFTISGWIKLSQANGYMRLFSRKTNYSDNDGWEIEMNNASTTAFSARGVQNTTVTGSFPNLLNNWVHVALVYDGTKLSVYGNGVLLKEGTIVTATDNGKPLSLGNNSNGSEANARGFYDEFRLLMSSAGAEWVKAEYDVVANHAEVVSYGAVGSVGGNDVLKIEGLPAEIGNPSPDYGMMTDLSAGETLSLSMANTEVYVDGIRSALRGWELYSINLENDEETLVRSYRDAGESVDSCAYVHNGFASFKWLWRQYKECEMALSVRSTTYNGADLHLNLIGMGLTADGGRLSIAYGTTPDNLIYTNDFGRVEMLGEYCAEISRLLPASAYYAQGCFVADGSEVATVTPVISFATPVLEEMSYKPGFWQTYFKAGGLNWDLDIDALPMGENWLQYENANRIRRRELGPIAAFATRTQKYTSELWGDQVYWPGFDQGQFVYKGHIRLSAGKSYKFRTKIDDNEYLAITSPQTGEKTVLINDRGSANSVQTSPTYVPGKTDWYEIEIRFHDGSGGAGGYDTTSSYINSFNAGYSQDDGATWDILRDPGDGSLLRTISPCDTILSEVMSGNALSGLKLDFPALGKNRTFYLATGAVYGGDDLAAWENVTEIGTALAGAETLAVPAPQGWGDEAMVARCYYLDDDNEPIWSTSVFWRDVSLPSVKVTELDGTGGDTLVVKGSVDAFTGEECVLTVYMGESIDAMDKVWTGLAGSVLTEAGDFELTLFEGDTEGQNYIAPNTKYFVSVDAAANGKHGMSEMAEVMTKGSVIIKSATASVTRRVLTVTTELADMGATPVAKAGLYVGNSNDRAALTLAGNLVDIAAGESAVLTHTFPAFETAYYWQVRVTNGTAGGTAIFEAESAITAATTKDSVTYTWKPEVAEGNWSDPNNWTDNTNGDSMGYPQSASSGVGFKAGRKAKIILTEPITTGTIWMNQNGMDITFARGAENKEDATLSANLSQGVANVKATFDGIKFVSSGQVDWATNTLFTLKNGAEAKFANFLNRYGGNVVVESGSLLDVNTLYLGLGSYVIDNATVSLRASPIIGNTKIGGAILFKGEAPRMVCTANAGFYSELANAGTHLDFVVPKGGYAEPPIESLITTANAGRFGNKGNNGAGTSPITINVLDESPANFAGETITTTLISWPAGIVQSLAIEGHLPVLPMAASSDDSFVWGTEENYPQSLGVTIASDLDQNSVFVSTYPEVVPGVSPAAGFVSLDGDVTFTALAEPVSLSAGRRAVAKGYKVYSIDSETMARTLIGEGDSLSCTLSPATGRREIEWQWEIQYEVSVTPVLGGTVTVSKNWVADGEAVRITATPNEGYGFVKFLGGLRREWSRAKETVLQVNGKPYTIEGVFTPALYVSTTGSDTNGGTSWEDSLATVAAALAKNPNAFVYVADGTYQHNAQVTLGGSAVISGMSKDCNAIFCCDTKIAGDVNTIAMFRLDGVDSRLENITLTTTYTSSTGGTTDRARGVFLNGYGTVESCVFRNCRSQYVPYYGGGGVQLKNGGVVRNCTFDGCSTYASGGNGATGGNILLLNENKAVDYPIVENCIILRGNAMSDIPSSKGGNIGMRVSNGGNGVIRNCLIAEGSSGHDAGCGVYMEGGTLENCTIVRNNKLNGKVAAGVEVYGGNAVTIRNSVIYGNENQGGMANWKIRANNSNTPDLFENNCSSPALPGKGNVDLDPSFRDMANGDYRLLPSEITDRGAKLDWMVGACDAGGVLDRILGAGPDLGCYEISDTEVSCGFTAESTGLLDEDTITVTAIVMGAGEKEITYTWTFTDKYGKVETHTGTDLATLTVTLPVGTYDISLAISGEGFEASSTRANVAKVGGAVAYVYLDGAHEFPYNTIEKAATNVLDAIEVVGDGGVVRLGPGWHRTNAQVALTKGITIVGDEGPEVTTIYAMAQVSGTTAVFLNHEDAVLKGVTVNGAPSTGYAKLVERWGGLELGEKGGFVTNCIIANHRTVNNTGAAGGLKMANGKIVDSVFSNNWSQCSGGAGFSGALKINGANALVDRCLIVSNRVEYGGTSYGGGVDVQSGTVRNCLIGWNRVQNYGGGVNVGGSGVVDHCTIVYNYAGSGNGGAYVSGNGVLSDCLLWRNYVNTDMEDATDPGFVDGANGDFHLSGASSAVDAGAAGGIGDYDLDGMARVSGRASDKGCYEFDQSQFTLGIAADLSRPFGPSDVTLRAVVTPEGTELDPEKTFWTVDGSEPSPNNYALKGAEGTIELESGIYTVRFKTEHLGTPYEITKEEWFTIYGETVYLVAENENAAAPYATPETAGTDINEVAGFAIEGATILIGDGNYTITNMVNLARAVTIKSVNGPGATVFDAKGKSALTCFVLNDDDAVISGITICNTRQFAGAGFTISKGMVTNCVVRDCVARGGVVSISGGMLVDTKILRIEPDRAVDGVGITQNGGIVERCLVEGCFDGGAENGKGNGAVYITNGEFRNSVVANNRLYNTGGIYHYNNGKVLSCTVADNVSYGDATKPGYLSNGANCTIRNTIIYGNTNEAAGTKVGATGNGTFVNCASETAIGSDCLILTRDPFLRMGMNYWMPKAKSQVRDAGVVESWMFGAKDFYGRSRIQGRTGEVDIGAVECDRELPMVFILR